MKLASIDDTDGSSEPVQVVSRRYARAGDAETWSWYHFVGPDQIKNSSKAGFLITNIQYGRVDCHIQRQVFVAGGGFEPQTLHDLRREVREKPSSWIRVLERERSWCESCGWLVVPG